MIFHVCHIPFLFTCWWSLITNSCQPLRRRQCETFSEESLNMLSWDQKGPQENKTFASPFNQIHTRATTFVAHNLAFDVICYGDCACDNNYVETTTERVNPETTGFGYLSTMHELRWSIRGTNYAIRMELMFVVSVIRIVAKSGDYNYNNNRRSTGINELVWLLWKVNEISTQML